MWYSLVRQDIVSYTKRVVKMSIDLKTVFIFFSHFFLFSFLNFFLSLSLDFLLCIILFFDSGQSLSVTPCKSRPEVAEGFRSGGSGFFLACKDFEKMVDLPFSACAFFFFLLLFLKWLFARAY